VVAAGAAAFGAAAAGARRSSGSLAMFTAIRRASSQRQRKRSRAEPLRIEAALIQRFDTPNGKPHFVVARGTLINADMRVSSFRQWIGVVDVHFSPAPTSGQFSATGH
jgi:hypothetical protein